MPILGIYMAFCSRRPAREVWISMEEMKFKYLSIALEDLMKKILEKKHFSVYESLVSSI
jgi:hypothetical protein